MSEFSKIFILFACLCFMHACGIDDEVSYNRDVKPIINKHCISCHGGVKKQGGFSLLFEEEALAAGKSGRAGIVPGHADKSEMYLRLVSEDPEERMPHEKDALSSKDINTIKNWINQGAKWEIHWAYQPIRMPAVPDIDDKWVKNDIDKFIIDNASKNNLTTSPQASGDVLLRRAALDIIGFPADDRIKNHYLNDPSDINYEKYIDQLLQSPAYGEKWATMWLDMARYADSKGYEKDSKRNIWRYRDWLIRSFNEDKPYDKFVTEQLAGDLMPQTNDTLLIATAMHRNTMTNDEGGTDNEEFRTASVIDRVNTTWETLMGTSFSCIQCHSHPYDPINHEDYYKFYAFFNNTRDEDTFNDDPKFRHYNDEQKVKFRRLDTILSQTITETQKQEIVSFLKTLQPSIYSHNSDLHVNSSIESTSNQLILRSNKSSVRIKDITLTDKKSIIMKCMSKIPNGILQIRTDSLQGKIVASLTLNDKKTKPTDPKPDWKITEVLLKPSEGVHDLYFVLNAAGKAEENGKDLKFEWFYFSDVFPIRENVEANTLFYELLSAKVESTPVMVENPAFLRRKSFVFDRGVWTAKGKEVQPGVPAAIGKWPLNAPANRLGMAQWMTSKDHPLFARTMVNRIWEQIFGMGLVETLEDLGSQCADPSNKELLDYLSYKFMHDYKWSIKKLIREIMISATYKQDSKVSPTQLSKDPYNKFLARGPRVRLSAEQIRDQALAISGNMDTKMYGPPVMPVQPANIWNSPYSNESWKTKDDSQKYRRAIYTYWKRTSPYPSFITFDGVGREVCVSRRIRTNTPLQALTTLNDSVYLDLSVKMAHKVKILTKNNVQESITKAFEIAAGVKPAPAKLQILMDLHKKSCEEYRKKPALSQELIGEINPQDAALVLVCNSILNLDEVITKN